MTLLALIASLALGQSTPVRPAAPAAKDPLPAGMARPPPARAAPPPVPAPAPPARRLPEDDRNVRVQLRKLSLKLAESFKALPGQGKLQTIAVLPFTDVGEEARKRQVGTLVSSEIATSFKRDQGFYLVERDKLEAALREAYLSETGITDPKSAVKLGEMLAAQALVVGEVTTAGAEYLVNARILSTESGEIFTAEQTKLPAEGLVSYADDAVVLRTKGGAVFRSLLLPGWGQFYNRQEAKSWIFIGGEATLLGGALGFHLLGANQQSIYVATGQSGPYQKAERMYELRNVALVLVGVGWGLNVLDAYLNGRTYDPARAGGD